MTTRRLTPPVLLRVFLQKTSNSASPSLLLARFGSSGHLSISQTEITIERKAFSGHFHNTSKCDRANQGHSERLV
jgi:hypothetical protein